MLYKSLLLISIIISIINIIVDGANTRRSWDKERRKNLQPQIMSERYDNETVALEFDNDCLNDKSISVDEMLNNILTIYPCLSYKFNNNRYYNHGQISRGYFIIDNNNKSCLEITTIDWNTYCLYQISYDLILQLYSVQCISDVINNIQINGVKKAYAWHLDAIDGNKDNIYKKPDISFDGTDRGIDVWVLDSGVLANHQEFATNQIIDEDKTWTTSNKHGTAVASCVAGNHYGSARGFTIHDYPVCRSSTGGCSFSYIDIGLNKALTHMKTTGRRSVINMSLGSSGALLTSYWGSYYDSLFQNIINAGGIIVVSAGNDNVDACNYWFSYSDKVISVGAHDSLLKRSSFSNYGACVDIYAPGTSLPVAATDTDPNFISYMSGTSFASPLIAGIVANLLYEDNSLTKNDILSLLQSHSYPISNCTGNFCKGAKYNCVDTTIAPTPVPTQKITGCCTSIRNTARLNRYCRPLQANECSEGRNGDYCYFDTKISPSQCTW